MMNDTVRNNRNDKVIVISMVRFTKRVPSQNFHKERIMWVGPRNNTRPIISFNCRLWYWIKAWRLTSSRRKVCTIVSAVTTTEATVAVDGVGAKSNVVVVWSTSITVSLVLSRWTASTKWCFCNNFLLAKPATPNTYKTSSVLDPVVGWVRWWCLFKTVLSDVVFSSSDGWCNHFHTEDGKLANSFDGRSSCKRLNMI